MYSSFIAMTGKVVSISLHEEVLAKIIIMTIYRRAIRGIKY